MVLVSEVLGKLITFLVYSMMIVCTLLKNVKGGRCDLVCPFCACDVRGPKKGESAVPAVAI